MTLVYTCRATKNLLLTLQPRRRGKYRLRLNLHAATVPQLPKGPGSYRSLSAGSANSSPGAAPAAGTLSTAAAAAAAPADGTGSPCSLGSAASSPSPRGSSVLALMRHARSAGGMLRSSLSASRDSGSKAMNQTPAGLPVAEPLDAIRAAKSARVAAVSREDDMATVGDCGSGCDNGTGGSSTCAGLQLDRPPLATAAVTADASFPSLLLTDVFCEGLPKQVRLNSAMASAFSGAGTPWMYTPLLHDCQYARTVQARYQPGVQHVQVGHSIQQHICLGLAPP